MITIEKKGLSSFKKYLKENHLNEEDYICKYSSNLFTPSLKKSLAILRNKQTQNKLIEPIFMNYKATDLYNEEPIYHYRKKDIEIYIKHLKKVNDVRNKYENQINDLKNKKTLKYKIKRKINHLKKIIENQSFAKILGMNISIFLIAVVFDISFNNTNQNKYNHTSLNYVIEKNK